MPGPLSARLVRRPRPLSAAPAGVPSLDAALRPLVDGAAACSPHLAHLLAREGGWIGPALDDPEGALGAALAEAAAGDPRPALRQAKRRVGLLAALMDLGGAWGLEEVTDALTRLADLAVDRSLRAAAAAALARARLPCLGDAGGMAALAMGKMGAHELNYSSDVDLVLLWDDARWDRADLDAARAAFVRAARAMTATLQDRDADGYAFRVDLRLRPDAAVTPPCVAMGFAEAYYESLGRTWERAAYIKARACGGDAAAGARFLDALRPFVWRRHLDFAAIEDAHDIRLRIRDHRGLHGPIALAKDLDRHDLKLGRGGIREIEFFAQTRQLIAGGRDPSLRARGTLDALARLADAGWVPRDAAARLSAHYRRLREVEHRLQMIADQQTHALPATPEGWARLAALMGEEEDALRADLRDRLAEVDALTEGFFAPDAAPAPPRAAPEAAPEEWGATDWGAEVMARWPSYPALRSARAGAIFARLRPEILRRLRDAARPPEALAAFDAFLAGLPAGVQVFSLFDRNPELLRLIAAICAASPALARYLGRNAGVLDAVIGGGFWAPWPGRGALRGALALALAQAPDYESRLGAARGWAREWWFRVGVHFLQGLTDAEGAGRQYADLACAVLGALLPAVLDEHRRKHGSGPGWAACVLGLGSLGAGRLTAASDLDLIVIYDAAGEQSDGPRPLATRAYFARATQALVTALTAPMAAGRLYAVDMRLRPSGRQGPVATSWDAFRDYQGREAWTWEHLALTRARVVAGDEALGAAVERFRADLVASRAGEARVRADTAAMRARLLAAWRPDAWDPKAGPGRLRDAELAAQAVALLAGSPARATADQLAAGVAAGLVPEADAAAIGDAARLLGAVQAVARLLVDGPLDPGALGEGGVAMLLRETGEPSVDALARRIAATTARAAAAIDRAVAP